MKTLVILVCSVFAYRVPLDRLQRTRLHTTLLPANLLEMLDEMSENHWENVYYPYFALILAGYSMFPNMNIVCLSSYKICSLKGLISCNSDNSLQTVIIIGHMYILW